MSKRASLGSDLGAVAQHSMWLGWEHSSWRALQPPFCERWLLTERGGSGLVYDNNGDDDGGDAVDDVYVSAVGWGA